MPQYIQYVDHSLIHTLTTKITNLKKLVFILSDDARVQSNTHSNRVHFGAQQNDSTLRSKIYESYQSIANAKECDIE